MNDLDLCLEVVQGHVNHCGVNISKTNFSQKLQIWYTSLFGKCRAGAEIIFPESGRGLGHVTPTFLADRTNGRAYATVLRLSVCRLSSVCL